MKDEERETAERTLPGPIEIQRAEWDGNHEAAIARFKRAAQLAVERLTASGLNQMTYRLAVQVDTEAVWRGEPSAGHAGAFRREMLAEQKEAIGTAESAKSAQTPEAPTELEDRQAARSRLAWIAAMAGESSPVWALNYFASRIARQLGSDYARVMDEAIEREREKGT